MHYRIIILLITTFILSACKNNPKQDINKTDLVVKQLSPKTIVIVSKDSLPILVNITKNNFEINPKTYLLGSKKNDTLNISTDSVLNLFILNNYRFRLHFKFIKGDTITITQKTILFDHEFIGFPYCIEKHNRLNSYELNLEYYITKLSQV